MKKCVIMMAAAALAAAACNEQEVKSPAGQWKIVAADGEMVQTEENTPYIVFGEDGKMHGCLGVNLANGEYKLRGDRFKIGNMGMTMMAGAPQDMAVEDKVRGALNEVERISYSADTLKLSDSKGNVRLAMVPATDAEVSQD